MNKTYNIIVKFIEKALILIFAILVIDVLWQVFSRYVLAKSFSFTEELARFLLIWLSILGAVYLNAKREHLSMDFVFNKLSKSRQQKVSILGEVCIFLFALVVMIIGGMNLVYTTLYLGQLSGTMRIPLGYVYAILPLAGLLICFFSIFHIINLSNSTKKDQQITNSEQLKTNN